MRETLRRSDPTLVAIIAEGFLSRLSFGLISFALPLYAYHLGLNLAQIGVLASLNLIVAIVLKPLMGWVADRWGLKPSLTTSILMRTSLCLLLVGADEPWQLFAIRILHGVSISLRDPAVNALIAEHGGKKTIASSFAWYQTAKSLAGASGKAAAGILLAVSSGSFSFVFASAFVLSALPILVVIRFVRETKQPSIRAGEVAGLVAPPPDDADVDQASTRPSTFPFVLLGFLISGTATMLTNLFPLLATEYAGLSTAQAGMVYVIATLFILSGPLWGWLSDHVSHRLVFFVRSVSNTLSSLVYLLVPNFAGVVVGRSLDDMGKAAYRPAWGALMAQVSSYDRRRRARTMSIMSMGEDAGEVVGPILAGFLWGTWGVAALLLTRAGLAVLSEIYTVFVTRSLRSSDAPDRDDEPDLSTPPNTVELEVAVARKGAPLD
ncbi:MAG: MFS transporter [Actinomycetota bacterium]|nr:MFS transporter [Actinomycetota bacterium]